MDASAETAAEVGRELSRVVMQPAGDGRSEAIQDLIVRLVQARSETTTDAMVLLAWATALVQETAANLSDGTAGAGGDARFLLTVCASLLSRAETALQTAAGVSGEAPIGAGIRLH